MKICWTNNSYCSWDTWCYDVLSKDLCNSDATALLVAGHIYLGLFQLISCSLSMLLTSLNLRVLHCNFSSQIFTHHHLRGSPQGLQLCYNFPALSGLFFFNILVEAFMIPKSSILQSWGTSTMWFIPRCATILSISQAFRDHGDSNLCLSG